MDDADDGACDDRKVAGAYIARPGAGLEQARQARDDGFEDTENGFPRRLVEESDFAQGGQFRLVRIQGSGNKISDDFKGAVAGLSGLTELAGHDFGGSQVNLEHQVFPILDIV